MITAYQLKWRRAAAGYQMEPGTMPPAPARYPQTNRRKRDANPDVVVDLAVARTGEMEPLKLDGGAPETGRLAFEEFQAADTPEKMLKFVSNYGPLFDEEIASGKVYIGSYQPLRMEIDNALVFAEDERWKDALSHRLVKGDTGDRALTSLKLLPDRERPVLMLEAISLWDFLVLELAAILSGSDIVKTCSECGRRFTITRKKGMRSHRKHCGDTCKKAAYRKRLALKAAKLQE